MAGAMTLLRRMFGGTATTADRPDPSPLTDGRFWGDGPTFTMPQSVATAEQAARVAAVAYVVGMIAETVGSLPLDFLEGDQPAEGFGLGETLAYAPNPLQTGAEFWSAMAFAAALRGRAYAEPVDTVDGVAIWALDPMRTSEDWRDRSMSVTYMPDDGPHRVLGPGELFWFCGLADATLRPLTPWRMAKGSLDFALAMETQGRSSFANGNRPGGALETAEELGDEAFDRINASMKQWKPGQNVLLESGLTYRPIQVNNADAKLPELIEQKSIELARYWRFPACLMDPKSKWDQSAVDGFVKFAIRPWARRIEQAITQRLFTPEMRARYRAKLNLDGLLRGDSATQARNAVLYRTAGTHSINDVRTKVHGLPRIDEPWADDVREPLNSNRAADTFTGGETAPQDDPDRGKEDR